MVQLEVRQTISDTNRGAYLDVVRTLFIPAVSRQEGFVRFLLLEEYPTALQSEIEGTPAECTFVIQLSFESEDLRQRWTATPEHDRLGQGLSGLIETSTHTGYEVREEATVGHPVAVEATSARAPVT